jgi:hypothetical protein
MKRRDFLNQLGKTGIATWTLRVNVTVFGSLSSGVASAVDAYDLVIDGYSTFDGARLGKAGVLKATQIAALQPITGIPYEQDSHGHTFDLASADLQSLLDGQAVSKITTEMQSHTHEVRISPSNRNDPNQQGVPVTTASNTTDSSQSTSASSGSLGGAVDQHCTECHHNGSAIPLDLTKKVSASDLEKIEARMRATDSTRMPPDFRDSPSEDQIKAILQALK